MKLERSVVTLVVATLTGLAVGIVAALVDRSAIADISWAATGLVAAVPLVGGFVNSLRRREWGLDVIALLAIVGAVVLGEYLAAAIVGVMLATGEALDSYAAARARGELTALLERAPREAHLSDSDVMETIPVERVEPGDRLVVLIGEVVPVDGVVVDSAVLDESSLTGESIPVVRREGDHVSSGALNGGGSFHMVATARAKDSAYAGIVRLVREAQESKPSVSRLADRYAMGFVPLALGIAAVAWVVSGDPVRALAVLVVATPCPLLLAVPIAIVSGVSRAAHKGIIVKGGAVLERLADAEILIMDKTGTLTAGEASLSSVAVFTQNLDETEILRLGASLDQMSNHVLAEALVRAARERGVSLTFPQDAAEVLGSGISGTVDGRSVSVGNAEWISQGNQLSEDASRYRRRGFRSPGSDVYIAVDSVVVGAFRLGDSIRPDTPRTIRALRRQGIRTVTMATGDHPVVADSVGAALGIDRILAQCTPEEKVEAVRRSSGEGVTVMVGDGINDAPALAVADVGVAMGARGATSSSEAADVVLIVDRLDRLAEAMRLASRSRSIAAQSAFLGMGLSLVAMVAATFGLLPPVAGALVQELIDVVAIVNAMRALGDGVRWRKGPQLPADLSARLRAEHDELMPALGQISQVADTIDRFPTAEAVAELRRIDRFLQDEVLPHEQQDDREIYPVLSGLLGGEDPMAAMSLTHGEIFRLAGLYHRLVDDVAPDGPDELDLFDLRRVLYGLHAVLQLHFAQEEELYQSLDEGYHERVESSSMAHA